MTTEIQKRKILKCLIVRKFVDIGILRQSTVTKVTAEVVKVAGVGLKITRTIPQVITEVVGVKYDQKLFIYQIIC